MQLDAFQQQITPLFFKPRKHALEHLENIVRSRLQIDVSWPDLLLYITPEDFNAVVEYTQGRNRED